MKHHRPQRASKLVAPLFWVQFFELFLSADAHLAVDIWKQLFPSEAQPLLYQLSKVEEKARHPDTVKRFGDLASPELLMRACGRLAPSGSGTPRRRDVVALEESILALCDAQGKWL